MKSFALEICAADHVVNRSGDTAIFFGSEDVAGTVSTTRNMDDFKGIRRFKAKLKSIPDSGGTTRFQVTNGAIKFPDKTFFLLPANLNTLQQKNLGFAGMQDALCQGAAISAEFFVWRMSFWSPDFFGEVDGEKGDPHGECGANEPAGESFGWGGKIHTVIRESCIH